VARPCQEGIRIRSTVGSRVTSVPAIVRDAQPSTFRVRCACRSAIQARGSWTIPAPIRAPKVPPTSRVTTAARYNPIGSGCRRFSPILRARSTSQPSTAAAPMNAVPPAATNPELSDGYPTAMSPAPALTPTNCAATTQPAGPGAAVSVRAKFCIAPAIADDTPPASARWSGSHTPSRSASGSSSERTAAVSHTLAAA
jgi:hypothetical protein